MNKHNSRFITGCWKSAWPIALMGLILTLQQRVSFAAPPTPDQVAQARNYMQTYYAWLNAPWTDDDRPYQHMRQVIEQAISHHANPFDLLKQRQKDLDKVPSDPKAQFAYYYTAYQAATWPKRPDNTEFSIGVQILGNLFIAILRTPHPHTYNYVRLEFLCGQYNFIDPNRKAVGLRLVHRDPSDYDVKYYTIASLIPSPLLSDHTIALKYANTMVTEYPKKPSSHSLAGYLHYQSWLQTKNKQDAAVALSQYQQYLQLEPRRSTSRKQAESIIAELQRG